LEGALERFPGALGVAVVELGAAEADPGRDIAAMLLDAGTQNFNRLVELTLRRRYSPSLKKIREDGSSRSSKRSCSRR
jgi:hypothetical protein